MEANISILTPQSYNRLWDFVSMHPIFNGVTTNILTTILLHFLGYQKKKYSNLSYQVKSEQEVGGGIGMGNTCKSMADSCQCMAKITTIL